ncbi:MAG: WecB/TagA/CpsF family glycosyltransferase [Kiritimatiellae bacterium]|nr:WecB/TagA/CpsF family glycosyltransferase [Kiritimatiellia bacterium]
MCITQQGIETISLFQIPVAKVTEKEAVERILGMVREGRDAAQSGQRRRTRMVATLNVDFVANAVSGWPFGGNTELWGYLKSADLVTADGMPIVLLSKLLFRPLPERVAGADLVPALCRRCAEEGLRVYVLGCERDAVEEAFRRMEAVSENSRAILSGHDTSIVNLDEERTEIVERINSAKPDLLFVALGNPKQELWMGRNIGKLEVPVMMGIGGTFNFLAGRVKRAPRWMQRCGLEWIYRIIQEPGRLWRRYAYGLVKFSWLSLRSILGGYR